MSNKGNGDSKNGEKESTDVQIDEDEEDFLLSLDQWDVVDEASGSEEDIGDQVTEEEGNTQAELSQELKDTELPPSDEKEPDVQAEADHDGGNVTENSKQDKEQDESRNDTDEVVLKKGTSDSAEGILGTTEGVPCTKPAGEDKLRKNDNDDGNVAVAVTEGSKESSESSVLVSNFSLWPDFTVTLQDFSNKEGMEVDKSLTTMAESTNTLAQKVENKGLETITETLAVEKTDEGLNSKAENRDVMASSTDADNQDVECTLSQEKTEEISTAEQLIISNLNDPEQKQESNSEDIVDGKNSEKNEKTDEKTGQGIEEMEVEKETIDEQMEMEVKDDKVSSLEGSVNTKQEESKTTEHNSEVDDKGDDKKEKHQANDQEENNLEETQNVNNEKDDEKGKEDQVNIENKVEMKDGTVVDEEMKEVEDNGKKEVEEIEDGDEVLEVDEEEEQEEQDNDGDEKVEVKKEEEGDASVDEKSQEKANQVENVAAEEKAAKADQVAVEPSKGKSTKGVRKESVNIPTKPVSSTHGKAMVKTAVKAEGKPGVKVDGKVEDNTLDLKMVNVSVDDLGSRDMIIILKNALHFNVDFPGEPESVRGIGTVTATVSLDKRLTSLKYLMKNMAFLHFEGVKFPGLQLKYLECIAKECRAMNLRGIHPKQYSLFAYHLPKYTTREKLKKVFPNCKRCFLAYTRKGIGWAVLQFRLKKEPLRILQATGGEITLAKKALPTILSILNLHSQDEFLNNQDFKTWFYRFNPSGDRRCGPRIRKDSSNKNLNKEATENKKGKEKLSNVKEKPVTKQQVQKTKDDSSKTAKLPKAQTKNESQKTGKLQKTQSKSESPNAAKSQQTETQKESQLAAKLSTIVSDRKTGHSNVAPSVRCLISVQTAPSSVVKGQTHVSSNVEVKTLPASNVKVEAAAPLSSKTEDQTSKTPAVKGDVKNQTTQISSVQNQEQETKEETQEGGLKAVSNLEVTQGVSADAAEDAKTGEKTTEVVISAAEDGNVVTDTSMEVEATPTESATEGAQQQDTGGHQADEEAVKNECLEQQKVELETMDVEAQDTGENEEVLELSTELEEQDTGEDGEEFEIEDDGEDEDIEDEEENVKLETVEDDDLVEVDEEDEDVVELNSEEDVEELDSGDEEVVEVDAAEDEEELNAEEEIKVETEGEDKNKVAQSTEENQSENVVEKQANDNTDHIPTDKQSTANQKPGRSLGKGKTSPAGSSKRSPLKKFASRKARPGLVKGESEDAVYDNVSSNDNMSPYDSISSDSEHDGLNRKESPRKKRTATKGDAEDAQLENDSISSDSLPSEEIKKSSKGGWDYMRGVWDSVSGESDDSDFSDISSKDSKEKRYRKSKKGKSGEDWDDDSLSNVSDAESEGQRRIHSHRELSNKIHSALSNEKYKQSDSAMVALLKSALDVVVQSRERPSPSPPPKSSRARGGSPKRTDPYRKYKRSPSPASYKRHKDSPPSRGHRSRSRSPMKKHRRSLSPRHRSSPSPLRRQDSPSPVRLQGSFSSQRQRGSVSPRRIRDSFSPHRSFQSPMRDDYGKKRMSFSPVQDRYRERRDSRVSREGVSHHATHRHGLSPVSVSPERDQYGRSSFSPGPSDYDRNIADIRGHYNRANRDTTYTRRRVSISPVRTTYTRHRGSPSPERIYRSARDSVSPVGRVYNRNRRSQSPDERYNRSRRSPSPGTREYDRSRRSLSEESRRYDQGRRSPYLGSRGYDQSRRLLSPDSRSYDQTRRSFSPRTRSYDRSRRSFSSDRQDSYDHSSRSPDRSYIRQRSPAGSLSDISQQSVSRSPSRSLSPISSRSRSPSPSVKRKHPYDDYVEQDSKKAKLDKPTVPYSTPGYNVAPASSVVGTSYYTSTGYQQTAPTYSQHPAMVATGQYVTPYQPPLVPPPPILTQSRPPYMYSQPPLPYLASQPPPAMMPQQLQQPPQMYMSMQPSTTSYSSPQQPLVTVTTKKSTQPQRRQLIPVPEQGTQSAASLSEQFTNKEAGIVDPPRRILFVGDSLINQLSNDFVGQKQNLNLHQRDYQIHCVGKLGGQVGDLEPPALNHTMNEIQPHNVFIQCGGDDLDSPNFNQIMTCLPTQLVSIAQRLVEGFGVLSVGIMQILPRQTTRHVPCDSYNKGANQVNQSIKALCKSNDKIFFWNHKNLKNTDVISIGNDGIRLTEVGMVKYFRSVRGVTLFVSRGGKKTNLQ